MATPARNDINRSIKEFSNLLGCVSEILFVGVHAKIDYSDHFCGNYETLDIDPRTNPDIVGDIQKCALSDENLDGIIMTGVYESLERPGAAMSEIRRMLKPKGKTLISVPGPGYYAQQEKTISLPDICKLMRPFLKIEKIEVTYYRGKENYIHVTAGR